MRLGVTILPEVAANYNFKITSVDIEPGMTDIDIEGIQKRFKKANVLPVQSSAYYNLASTNDLIRADAIKNVRKVLMNAEKIGCKFVVVGGGHRNPACPANVFSAHPANWEDEAIDVLADSCIKVLEKIPLSKTKIVLETWTMTPLNSPQKARRLFDKINHPQFGILLDIVNLMNLDRYFKTGEFIWECVNVLGDAIDLVHLKDTILNPELFTYHMSEAPVGKGNLDYPEVLSALNSLNKKDLILMIEHLDTIEQYIECTQFVYQIAKKMGIEIT